MVQYRIIVELGTKMCGTTYVWKVQRCVYLDWVTIFGGLSQNAEVAWKDAYAKYEEVLLNGI